MMEKFLYSHRRRDTGEIFYIGIGKLSRAYKFYPPRNKIWGRIVNKTGEPIVNILFRFESWELACRKEKRLIKLLGRIDNKTGQLSNMTDGGDGTLGNIPSIHQRMVTSERNLGDKNPAKRIDVRLKISVKTKEAMHRADIREKHLASMATIEFKEKTSIGTKKALSDPLVRAKISKAVKSAMAAKPFELKSGANNHRSKPILMRINGCPIAVFACAYEITRIYGVLSKRISACATGVRKHHKGINYEFYIKPKC